jgi:hypothetical protein
MINSGGWAEGMPITTIMVALLFGTNALLFLLFYVVKQSSPKAEEVADPKKKVMSKPFLGTLDCFYNMTSELFRTGAICFLTFMCEHHWIYDHSGKEYSRDLFTFVLIVFFAYAYITIKPVTDLTLLSREQTEEWKGWMQFIFLLYHYFHAEEVYNSVRVMITCYVWMTGFGNFSFFFVKRDFGWLRVMQMMWRLNFSVLLLMWTHGNTYILYYICPLHTFYFLMVYATMYVYQSVNHSKWGIRIKLMVVGFLIYLVWDVNGGLYDILFSFLGTKSVIGATRGSVWEYYFRTSLDHWSSFLGMIFAVNFPLCEQWFHKARGYPTIVAAVVLGGLSIWWYFEFYTKEKLEYNLTHSYSAIIPLTAYIFFRNITPQVRSGVSMSLHDLGKTTLETYLLQHHIWLTSNAKTLLTIVPDHPWINFALATMLFFTCAKELYRLTMSLRGMIMPEDKNIAWVNIMGMCSILGVLYLISVFLWAAKASLVHIALTCVGLFPVILLVIGRFARKTADNFTYQTLSGRAAIMSAVALVIGVMIALAMSTGSPTASTSTTASMTEFLGMPSGLFKGASPDCQAALSSGSWVSEGCKVPPAPALNKAAFCDSEKWVWDKSDSECPIQQLPTKTFASRFKNKKVAFVGDSIIRNTYFQFNQLLDPKYQQDISTDLKHTNRQFVAKGSNTSVNFIWAPYVNNVTFALTSANRKQAYDLFVAGSAVWGALHVHSTKAYSSDLNRLATKSGSPGKMVTVWMQPTTIIDGKLQTQDKQKYMTEDKIKEYRQTFLESPANAYFSSGGTVLDPTAASNGRGDGCIDGLHYTGEVYQVMAQMVANAFSLRNPKLYQKTTYPTVAQQEPKTTGSMSFPLYGLFVLIISAIMLFTMDSFLGVGYLSLLIFGRSLDWEAAYGPLLKKVLGAGKGAAQPDADAHANEKGERDTDKLLAAEDGIEMQNKS